MFYALGPHYNWGNVAQREKKTRVFCAGPLLHTTILLMVARAQFSRFLCHPKIGNFCGSPRSAKKVFFLPLRPGIPAPLGSS